MKQPVGSELRVDSKPVHCYLRADGLEPRYGENNVLLLAMALATRPLTASHGQFFCRNWPIATH
jgi:hypothetical protein